MCIRDRWYSHLSDQEHVGIIHGISKIIDSQGMIAVSYTHLDVYKRQTLRWLLMTILIAGVIGWWVAAIYMYNFIISQQQYSVYDLPLALPSTILDSKWRELYTFFDERRVLVSYDAISPLMIDALISAEDQDFWNNDGFDPRGIVRSTVVTLRDRWENGFLGYSQGASTLTLSLIHI